MTRSSKSVDAKLQLLLEHEFGKDAKHDEKVLLTALGTGPARVVAKAADLAAERLCYGAITALKEAFARFLEDAPKKDPQCLGKNAIVRALVTLDCPDARFYLAGLEYRQPEPVWGGSADSASDVRSSCAMGLVNSGDPRALHAINGEFTFGRIRLTPSLYRHELALHILRIANNKDANRTGISSMQMFELARRLNDSTDTLFSVAIL